ncbi:MAG: extracellular solute-binding protein [Actinomycetota bacterium]|nr:extracellular solute-binding protein [Actinomycetota bacterium]
MNSNPLSDLSSMHLTRRGVLGIGAALGVGAAVSACGGGSSAPPGAQQADIASGAYEGPKVELQFWNGFTGGDGAFMKKMVENFNSEHENIAVKMNVIEWAQFYSKLPNAVASGAGPDCAAMHVDQVGTNAARRVIAPLGDAIQELKLEERDFNEVVWNAGLYNEERYAIPLDIHPLGFWQNKAHVAKAGIEKAPQDMESWESSLAALKQKAVPNPYWATATWPGFLVWISALNQMGGSVYNQDATEATFASKEGVEALEWYKSHIDKGFSPKNVASDADFSGFQQQRSSYVIDGIWRMNNWAEVKGLEWSAAPVPTWFDKPAVWASSHQLVMMQQKNPDENKLHATRDFLAYLSENSIEWAKAGQIPARNSVRESQDFQALEVQSTLAKQTDHVVFAPTVAGIGDVPVPTYEAAFNTTILGKTDAKSALQAAQKKANQILKDNRDKYSA